MKIHIIGVGLTDIIRIMPNDISWNHQLDFIFDPYIVHHLGPYKPYSNIPDKFKYSKKFMYFKKEYIVFMKELLNIPFFQ